MLVTVGGSPAPIICSLNVQQPEFICFFCSPESKELIFNSILPRLTFRPRHFDWIQTEDGESLSACYQALRAQLPALLRKWSVEWSEVLCDFTGGTKVMSSSALLATVRHVSRYTYVGSRRKEGRTKEGLGIVIDGQERVLTETNPWKDMAEEELAQLALLFNQAQFAAAAGIAERLRSLVPTNLRPFFSATAEAIRGYEAWDRFDYKTAINLLRRARGSLVPYSVGQHDVLAQLAGYLDGHIAFLEQLWPPPPARQDSSTTPTQNKSAIAYHRFDTIDVIANAGRRATVERRYDDAVARLYSAIEAVARYRLADVYGIDNSHARLEQIPESLRLEFQRHYADDNPSPTLAFGLTASYELLRALGDEMGERFIAVKDELDSLLAARNTSRLAHGTIPVKESVYERLHALALRLAGIGVDELPQFPQLRAE